MSNMMEVRWHGRGGQGAKTAALLLADAAFDAGKYVQGFPEYGPERMGAPITAYTRISSDKITIHSNIYEPDYVVVVDETLIGVVDVMKGLKPAGAVIVNTEKKPDEIRRCLENYDGRLYTIDAQRISQEALGRPFPNTPMLGAVVKVSGMMADDEFIKTMQHSFEHKFASKTEVVAGNMKALVRSMQEVHGDEN
ncbi:2-oxoacid:acceptor oxidoreductase family protein [Anoxynatronum buryatiense]|uniref:Pyruvate ferredoxin oxidoreductase gamma subunit n=1 Tax=Anoxynatronum buryatiense TaxID=489973 RepID=A0AA46AHP8_9CLOT|nr:2-oxoacid:acceptor oxidoreductase family protein [Anoxynatronum buryatiense]SMP41075.1 pyruvate ferredoxin oxidoreductase gamma subunit [Anoxynatronum buryatiense]